MVCNVLVNTRHILGGIPVFNHTRVPFQAFLDHLESGQSIDDFLNDFPTVRLAGKPRLPG